jgi:hypothetical protein
MKKTSLLYALNANGVISWLKIGCLTKLPNYFQIYVSSCLISDSVKELGHRAICSRSINQKPKMTKLKPK